MRTRARRAIADDRPPEPAPPLIVFDEGRRTYIGLSNDRTYWHVVRPAREDDAGIVWVDDRPDPALVCSCAAGRRGRSCYRVREALAYEDGLPTSARPIAVLPGQTGLFEEPQP